MGRAPPGNARHACLDDASLWTRSRSPDRQAHSEDHERIPVDQHGSLYPALHRLEKRGWVSAKWETAPDRNQEFKYYWLTDKGRKQLVIKESQWKQTAEAVALVMWPATEEN
jgi:DNA-binding PadR family transcriptional regulator